MTEETEEHLDPMERAVANGFKEPDAPSKEDRVKAVITAIDHAIKHNSPIALAMREEIVALLAGHPDEAKSNKPA